MHRPHDTQKHNGGYLLNNQIDLGRIYGIQDVYADAGGLEPKNFITSSNIPSLEQIAEYNLASRGINPNPQNNSSIQTLPSDIGADYPTGVPYDADYNINIPPNSNQFTSTPTTTLNASMNAGVPTTDINQVGGNAITDFSNPFPVTAESIQYLNGFIRTQIGRRITVTFLVGSNLIEEKSGFLLGVGANYILINELDTNDLTACDFYNIKFIRFYY